jgi:hypothetical protein
VASGKSRDNPGRAEEKETMGEVINVQALVGRDTSEQAAMLQAAIEHCRELLGVSEFSSKRFIKSAIYENFWWKESKQGHTRQQFEAAVALLLKHHQSSTSAEAKAARAQEEADKKIRNQFTNRFYLVKRAEVLVIDKELASVRRVLRRVYENLKSSEKMAFIRIAGNVFNLNRREKAAIAKQDAENKAKWDAARETQEAVTKARDAYWKESNPQKKEALWKTYLALTKPERDKKAAAKRAEEKRIADGLASVEATKTANPTLWSEAVSAAARAAAIQVLGRYFWGAQLHEGKGTVGSYAGSSPTHSQKIQEVVMAFAAVNAHHKLGVLLDDEYPAIAADLNGYLNEFCAASGLEVLQVVQELGDYARALVNTNWDAILRVGTYLLASGSIKNGRTLRKIAGVEFQKPAFQFSRALAALSVLLPVTTVIIDFHAERGDDIPATVIQ